jgi:hypothetical protein
MRSSSFTINGVAGKNHFHFTGRLNGKKVAARALSAGGDADHRRRRRQADFHCLSDRPLERANYARRSSHGHGWFRTSDLSL